MMRSIKQSEAKLRHPAERPTLQPASAAKILFHGQIEAAPDAIVIVAGTRVITLINRQTEALFG
jgi:hypothetical protein